MQCREALIQELRSTTYSMLDAFKGDYTQQALQYEQHVRQLQAQLHQQPAPASEAPDSGTAISGTGLSECAEPKLLCTSKAFLRTYFFSIGCNVC